jgi:hypothetical protein
LPEINTTTSCCQADSAARVPALKSSLAGFYETPSASACGKNQTASSRKTRDAARRFKRSAARHFLFLGATSFEQRAQANMRFLYVRHNMLLSGSMALPASVAALKPSAARVKERSMAGDSQKSPPGT